MHTVTVNCHVMPVLTESGSTFVLAEVNTAYLTIEISAKKHRLDQNLHVTLTEVIWANFFFLMTSSRFGRSQFKLFGFKFKNISVNMAEAFALFQQL